MSLIQKVVPRKNYRLEIMLDNGSSLIVSLEFQLGRVRFCLLAEEAFFKRATTDGRYVRWEDQIELSIGELFRLAQK